jgi:hypothetical protein
MQTLEFGVDKSHWFGGVFLLDSRRGITTVAVSGTLFKLKALWKVVLPWDGFRKFRYLDLRGYILTNHFRFGFNSMFVDYDSTKEEKLVVLDTGGES